MLAFFFPIVGLILYLVWKDQKPRCAHAIGKWALIGFIANTILIIIGIVFSLLLYSVAAPSYYDFWKLQRYRLWHIDGHPYDSALIA